VVFSSFSAEIAKGVINKINNNSVVRMRVDIVSPESTKIKMWK
jgi:hypothetical protein